jgi:chromosome partitioning protein
MARDMDNERPRRRLFGRRRPVEEAAAEAPDAPAEAPSPAVEPPRGVHPAQPSQEEPLESSQPTGHDAPPGPSYAADVAAADGADEAGAIAPPDPISPGSDLPEEPDVDEGTLPAREDESVPPPEPVAARARPGAQDSDGTGATAEPEKRSGRSAALAEAGFDLAGDEPDSPAQTLPRVIAIANQKGGVGKTTTAVNLGAALAEVGFRVLVVDLDPQGNATTGLGINPRDVSSSIYDVIMHDTPALDCVEPTSLKNLFVIPATIDLAGAEIELVPAFSRELKLKRALDTVRSEYDYVLIDCPPSLGLLTVNGLAGANDVIVPIQCEYYALEGLGQLLRNVALVRSNLNPTLDVRGIVLTMHDSRTRLADQVETEVREHFGSKVYETVVPRTVRLSEAPSFGQPIIVFDSTSRGAQAYRALAKEVSSGATRRTG